MIPAYAYLRVSGKGQIEGDGFDRQLLACQQYAQAHDIHIVRLFRDEGVCGATELSDRPALSELFAELSPDGVTTVIIEKLDRLARDVVVQELIVRDFMHHKYMLISSLEPDMCSTDPTRKFIRQIFGAVAEYEREMIVLKLRGARQRVKARTGRCEGRIPFGSTPEERSILDEIRKMRDSGLKCREIAEALNKNEVPTKLGGQWHTGTVAKILSRQKIAPKIHKEGCTQ